MSNKQTAVQWLIEQVECRGLTTKELRENFKQAKQMENDQIIDAWDSAIQAHEDRGHVLAKSWEDFEEYYAETYGKTFIDLVSDEESKVHEVVRKLKKNKEVTNEGIEDGAGIEIVFCKGNKEDETVLRQEGVFTETLIQTAKQYLESVNVGEMATRETSMVITKLDEALMWIAKRAEDRKLRGVQATYQK